MHRFESKLGGLLLSGLIATACGGAKSVSTNDTIPTFNGTYTLQGTIMDALTGARLGGTGLQVFLIQGIDQRVPDKLISSSKDPMMGDYAFSSIPAEVNFGDATYKMVVINQGYMRFESEFGFRASFNPSVLDATYNFIGDIYLFPTGTNATPYTVNVTYNTKPVSGAMVEFKPFVGNSLSSVDQSPHVLPATNGLSTALTATTDENGKAVFDGTQLSLGAAYYPYVDPMVFEGVTLGETFGNTINVGIGSSNQHIAMADQTNGGNPFGLFIASRSNSVAGQVVANGALSLTFSRPVIVNNPTLFGAFATAGTFNTTSVTASLSSDGLTLTLTPNWATAPAPGTANVQIDYVDNGDTVSPQGYPASTFPVFSLPDNTGSTTPLGLVFMTGP